MSDTTKARVLPRQTADLVARAAAIRNDHEITVFEARLQLARLLGAHHDPVTGLTSFGFWAPDLNRERIAHKDVHLEVFTPVEEVDLANSRQAILFRRERLPLESEGDYWWGVVEGVAAGSRDTVGAFYWLRATHPSGRELIVRDLVAHSIPFGSFAPAEVYDMVSLQAGRSDIDHYARDPGVPTSILELHIPTATRGGTIADLAETYEQIGARLRKGEKLAPAEQVYVDYDAIQPLPIDPTIEKPGELPTFAVLETVDEMEGLVSVLLHHPENLNWGYDNIVASSSATNPTLLRTRRPDELVRLSEALHNLPEPIMLLYDVVYGHADNQALQILPSRFFKGPNMYGQDLNHQDPTVRAILLEMQRRRINTGADGLRVDGAQDFKYYDPRTGEVGYDDDYLQSMSDVAQQIGPHRRKMWMIFEDGRPWPDEGWETSSTYRHVIERQPDTYQWGPLIFAHNTPMLDGFWSDKWWRVEQIAEHGGNWISGCANHDTVRRGTQVDPSRSINEYLGHDLPTILDNAYDNSAVTLISYALLPGIPMDFLNAATRTPWGFMRTTDDVYGVKVMAEEAGFLDWQLTDDAYEREGVMWRTKRHGFSTKSELRVFLGNLVELVHSTEYDLDAMAAAVAKPEPMRPGRDGLALLAQDFMCDLHDLCNVGDHLDRLDAERVAFAAEMRRLRRRHSWLRDDCRPGDVVEKVDRDQTIYRGHRVSPHGSMRVATVANMAGPEARLSLAEAMTLASAGEPDAVLVSPGADLDDGTLRLPDGTGVALLWKS